MSEFDDKPINSPDEDKFGFKPLAEAIADSISKMTRPEGTVIAINGPWGSGKSSFINLVRHHLNNSPKKDDLKIVDFKCWWFRGKEALTIAFFRELYSAMKPSLTWRAKRALSKLGQLLSLGDVGVAGKIISNIGKFFAQDETVEKLRKEIYKELQKSSERYLIVIDDIDRLSPDEAILIFQLVKSVGGLPNVMYLLAYDRKLAEKIVAERYPSEGPHYLEKIVQASFELPEPSQLALHGEYFTRIDNILDGERPWDVVYFDSLSHEIIMPEIKIPRDLVRIVNPLKFTWSAVKGAVNIADFLCIETLRIKRPELYYALRSNKDYLTKITPSTSFTVSTDGKTEHPLAKTCEDIFLKPEPEAEQERLRRGLMVFFPALARIWEFGKHEDNASDIWEGQRRICSPKHFDTYFRFARPDDV